MTFSQTKKPTSSVSTDKFQYHFKFYETDSKKGSMESKFKNKIQTAVSGTKHTVTTDKKNDTQKINLLFSANYYNTGKKDKPRQNAADQPTCSKTLGIVNNGGRATCIYSRKEAPKAIANYERSQDWLKKKDQLKTTEDS